MMTRAEQFARARVVAVARTSMTLLIKRGPYLLLVDRWCGVMFVMLFVIVAHTEHHEQHHRRAH